MVMLFATNTLSARPSLSYHPTTSGSCRSSYYASDAACRGSLSRPPSGSSRRASLRGHTWSNICPYSSSRCIGSHACIASLPSYPIPISQCDNVIKERLYRPPFHFRHRTRKFYLSLYSFQRSFRASRISAIDIRVSVHAAHAPMPKPTTTNTSTRCTIARTAPYTHHSAISPITTT